MHLKTEGIYTLSGEGERILTEAILSPRYGSRRKERRNMAVYLTDGRIVIVPVSMFPDIKRLNKSQRKDYMIMDDQYFSFDAISKIYSVKDILAC